MKIKEATTQNEKLAMQFHKIENLSHRLRREYRHQAQRGKAEKVSLHRGQGRALQLLGAEGPLSISQLVEQLDVRPSSAGELVKKMEASGFVTKEINEADKRIQIISITDAGKEIVAQSSNVNAEYFDDFFSGLTDEEQKQLSELLDKLVSSLKVKGEELDIRIKDCSRRRKTRHSSKHCR